MYTRLTECPGGVVRCRLEGNITRGTVHGLRDLQLLDVDIHLPGLSVAADLRLPLVTLDANYSLDGSFSGLFPLTGAGPLK